jgi:hypothetical protein
MRRVAVVLGAVAEDPVAAMTPAPQGACGFGVTGEAADVTDVGARLSGSVHNTAAEPTEYWFEYGLSTAYGSSTVRASVNVAPGNSYLVGVQVGGLAEGSTYHYRLCTAGSDGLGACGGDRVFTTTTGRDSVSGRGTVYSIPEIGYAIAASAYATSGPDGALPVNGVAATNPGRVYFKVGDSGPVSCLRVEGNRAAIGFVATTDLGQPDPQPIPIMLFVEDNGPSGDRIGHVQLAEPATTCPVPTDADFVPFIVGGSAIPPVLTSGDFTVHDHATG